MKPLYVDDVEIEGLPQDKFAQTRLRVRSELIAQPGFWVIEANLNKDIQRVQETGLFDNAWVEARSAFAWSLC